MKHRIGTKIPTTREVAELERRVEDIIEDLSAYSVTLSPTDRHRALKLRRGGGTIVSLVGRLATAFNIGLPDISVEHMTESLALAETLVPLAMAVAELDRRVNDTMIQARSESWWAMTAYYSTLVRLANGNPSIANAIKPVVEFFSTGPRKRLA